MFVTCQSFESLSHDNFCKVLKEPYIACNSSLVHDDCGGVCVVAIFFGIGYLLNRKNKSVITCHHFNFKSKCGRKKSKN